MSAPLKHIFLDMDGVLADFVSAAVELHERPEVLRCWPAGEWEVHRVLQISVNQFWAAIDRKGAAFWAELVPFPWARELMDRLNELAPVTIASSPSHDPACLEGKIRWLQAQFGRKFRNFMIGPRKFVLARPGTALVDDLERNVSEFRQHGGCGVLFPQPWNAAHHLTENRVDHVLRQLTPKTASTSEERPQ